MNLFQVRPYLLITLRPLRKGPALNKLTISFWDYLILLSFGEPYVH